MASKTQEDISAWEINDKTYHGAVFSTIRKVLNKKTELPRPTGTIPYSDCVMLGGIFSEQNE
jgi:hypothetical protein